MTRKKTNTVILPKDMFNRTDLKSFLKLSREDVLMKFSFDVGVWKQARKIRCLPNKSIKKLKAENRSWQSLENRMFAEAEKQNEEIKRLKARERRRERGRIIA